MDTQELRDNYAKYVANLITEFVLKEKGEGKTINTVNPWLFFYENLSKISKGACEGNNYPVTTVGATTAYMIIEQVLGKEFGDDYKKYCQNNPLELKIEEIVKKDIKTLIAGILKEETVKPEYLDKIIHIWVHRANNQPILDIKIVREDTVSMAQKRSDEEVKALIKEAMLG